jgi:deazaflavin-dependent oxidoreductase (nitroreductase family)
VGGSLTSGRTDDLGALDYCYLTTVGRVSGDAHEIEIWFALHDGFLYLLSGGLDGSDWVKNLRANADVTVRLGAETRAARARAWSPGPTRTNWPAACWLRSIGPATQASSRSGGARRSPSPSSGRSGSWSDAD